MLSAKKAINQCFNVLFNYDIILTFMLKVVNAVNKVVVNFVYVYERRKELCYDRNCRNHSTRQRKN